MPTGRLRLGAVLLLPPPLDREVDGLRRACGDGSLGRVPAHLTLVPPVNVRLDHSSEALAVLRSAAAVARPFSMALGPVATFLPATPVAYLSVAGAGVGELYDLRERLLRPPLARPLSWPFVPHVTLADGIDSARAAAAVAALVDYRVSVSFERVHLLREGVGRKWEVLADAAFSPPRVVGRGGLPLELSVTESIDADAAPLLEGLGSAPTRHRFDIESVPSGGRPLTVTGRREAVVVGFARGRTGGDWGVLESVAVKDGHRGQGVGTQLLAAFAVAAVERGCSRLLAPSEVGSDLDAFYRRRGWVQEPGLRWLRRDL